MRHWSASLVGLPYAPKGRSRLGVDCWGLVRLAFDAGAGITVPSYEQGYLSPDEAREIDAIVRREERSPLWHRVDAELREFDVLWFGRGQVQRHCGIYIRPGVMLHIEESRAESRLDDYRDLDLNLKLTGVYRWHELAR